MGDLAEQPTFLDGNPMTWSKSMAPSGIQDGERITPRASVRCPNRSASDAAIEAIHRFV